MPWWIKKARRRIRDSVMELVDFCTLAGAYLFLGEAVALKVARTTILRRIGENDRDKAALAQITAEVIADTDLDDEERAYYLDLSAQYRRQFIRTEDNLYSILREIDLRL